HEVIFSGEGMTLLTVDHIYTFKQSLRGLSDIKNFAAGYKRRTASCVQLLRRINNTYAGIRVSKSYLERAHDTPLNLSALEKVHEAYLRDFREPGVQGLTMDSEDSISRLPELESPTERQPRLPELESPTEWQPADLPSRVQYTSATAAELQASEQMREMAWSEAWDSPIQSPRSDTTANVMYPRVPTLTKVPGFPSPISNSPSSSVLTTTICSRCLVGIETQESACKQEMTMFLSPEWEDFRRIGLGILKG
ncbi:MAG: hypothetical protein Q9184_003296, partial [Pyrenodesmia sp. 2 TL-2023]